VLLGKGHRQGGRRGRGVTAYTIILFPGSSGPALCAFSSAVFTASTPSLKWLAKRKTGFSEKRKTGFSAKRKTGFSAKPSAKNQEHAATPLPLFFVCCSPVENGCVQVLCLLLKAVMSHFGEPAKEAVCDVLLPLVQIGHFDRYIGGEPLVRCLGKKSATTRKRSEDRKKAIFWGYYNGREKI
jgi:hypothetical protein